MCRSVEYDVWQFTTFMSKLNDIAVMDTLLTESAINQSAIIVSANNEYGCSDYGNSANFCTFILPEVAD